MKCVESFALSYTFPTCMKSIFSSTAIHDDKVLIKPCMNIIVVANIHLFTSSLFSASHNSLKYICIDSVELNVGLAYHTGEVGSQ